MTAERAIVLILLSHTAMILQVEEAEVDEDYLPLDIILHSVEIKTDESTGARWSCGQCECNTRG